MSSIIFADYTDLLAVQKLLVQLKCLKHHLRISVKIDNNNLNFSSCCDLQQSEAITIVEQFKLYGIKGATKSLKILQADRVANFLTSVETFNQWKNMKSEKRKRKDAKK